jgi:hypothetical protein
MKGTSMPITQRFTLILTLMLCAAASAPAQEAAKLFIDGKPVTAADLPSHDPMNAACDGAWRDVHAAALEGRRLGATLSAPAGRGRLLCLIGALGTIQHGDSDGYNRWMIIEKTSILLGVYGPEAFDFFAQQMDAQEASVQTAIRMALLDVGQPEAFSRYFAFRRERLARGEEWNRENTTSPTLFDNLIAKGACAALICSSRTSETLRIVSENLDIVQMELEGALRAALSERITSRTESNALHASAQRVLEMVERVRRGEVAIGRAAAAQSN